MEKLRGATLVASDAGWGWGCTLPSHSAARSETAKVTAEFRLHIDNVGNMQGLASCNYEITTRRSILPGLNVKALSLVRVKGFSTRF